MPDRARVLGMTSTIGRLCCLAFAILPANPVSRADDEPQSRQSFPAFAIRTAHGELRPYSVESSAGECGKVSDEHIDATVRPLGAKQWELELTSKATSLTEVWFPWEPRQTFLNNTPEDDLVYYPHLMGAAEKASTVKEWDWWGMDYPGDAFTPLVVVADDTAARIVAAHGILPWMHTRTGWSLTCGRRGCIL